MGVRILTRGEVERTTLDKLRFYQPGTSLSSQEAVAALIRRVASFLCPCSRRAVRTAVLQCLRHIVEDSELSDTIDGLLEDLIGGGDLVEVAVYQQSDEERPVLLHLAPSQFVQLKDGTIIVLGLEPDDQQLLPDALLKTLVAKRHLRRFRGGPPDLSHHLTALGFSALREQFWLKTPRLESPQQVIATYDQRIAGAPSGMSVHGLEILRPESPVTFYRGRWGPVDRRSARVVARRPQRFGANLWCYAEIIEGVPQRVEDLGRGEVSGADEAWRLQCALDAKGNNPQRFRIDKDPRAEFSLMSIYSPIPNWAQRWLDVVGEEAPRQLGALRTYQVPVGAVAMAASFLTTNLWMQAQ